MEALWFRGWCFGFGTHWSGRLSFSTVLRGGRVVFLFQWLSCVNISIHSINLLPYGRSKKYVQNTEFFLSSLSLQLSNSLDKAALREEHVRDDLQGTALSLSLSLSLFLSLILFFLQIVLIITLPLCQIRPFTEHSFQVIQKNTTLQSLNKFLLVYFRGREEPASVEN